MGVKLKMDGEYPFDTKNWEHVCNIPHELAQRMLGVAHFGPHDNNFTNKGYCVVSVDSCVAIAVYHCDGVFSIIENTEDTAVFEYMKAHPQLVAPEDMVAAQDLSMKCVTCYVIHNEEACPNCK